VGNWMIRFLGGIPRIAAGTVINYGMNSLWA
jgi:hypothetical protein